MNSKTTLWFNHGISSLDVILRALRSHPELSDCRVIVTNRFPASNLMALCDVYQVEPSFADTSDYLDWCTQFAYEHEVDFFFPQRHADRLLLAHEEFSTHGTEVVMHTGLFDPHLIDSKTWVYGDLEEAGLSSILPAVWVSTTSLSSIESLLESYSKPLCVKPDRGIYGEGFFVLNKGQGLNITQSPPAVGIDTLSHVFPYLYQNKACIVSEFLPGKEYSVDCAFDRGVLLSAVVRKKSSRKHQHIYTMDGEGGELIQNLFTYARSIGRILALNGWSNMQFKENDVGTPIFLEVNPRFSGGLGIAAMANPVLPVIPILNALGRWQEGMDQQQLDGKAITSSTVYSILE